MITDQVIYIVLIAVLSILIAVFQYFYKAKAIGLSRFAFAFLRFLTLFILGVLLLNPSISQKTTKNSKPNLVIAIDKSESINFLNKDSLTIDFIKKIKDSNLSKKFDIDFYSFGNNIQKFNDSITFKDNQTNIAQVFSTFKELYNDSNSPTLLLTDGNQTFGSDYILSSLTYKNPIYPIVLGDSIFNEDILIKNIQHNKYAFIGNEFPVEVTIGYVGKNKVTKNLSVYINGNKVANKAITLSENKTAVVVDFLLKANKIGRNKYSVRVDAIQSEKNVSNNRRDFSVNVIDERTNVLIVSDILHPDLGVLKKSIESNKHRKVTILKPSDVIDYNEFELLIVYQPTQKFKNIFKQIDVYKKNHLTITGLQTDWDFLNMISKNYHKRYTNNVQEFLPYVNSDFTLFQYDDLEFNSFPPLQGFYGDLKFKNPPFTVLYQKINNIKTAQPLFCFFDTNNLKEAVLFGEGLWKWRSQSYLNTKKFKNFDALIGKTVQYLSDNIKKERLIVTNKDTYLLGQAILEVQYFDNNYVFNPNEIIYCEIKNKENNEVLRYEYIYTKNNYLLDLSHLKAGDYEFIVNIGNNKLSKKGNFTIVDFNIESQFVNPNVTNMEQLATNSKTEIYYISNYKKIFDELEKNNKYKITQTELISEKELINWKYLIAILITLLSVEWFLRKYKGLI